MFTAIKIETYWNVNTGATEEPSGDAQEIKIETYWNVNQKTIELKRYENIIKIETYWNVNMHPTQERLVHGRLK